MGFQEKSTQVLGRFDCLLLSTMNTFPPLHRPAAQEGVGTFAGQAIKGTVLCC